MVCVRQELIMRRFIIHIFRPVKAKNSSYPLPPQNFDFLNCSTPCSITYESAGRRHFELYRYQLLRIRATFFFHPEEERGKSMAFPSFDPKHSDITGGMQIYEIPICINIFRTVDVPRPLSKRTVQKGIMQKLSDDANKLPHHRLR